MGPFFSVALLVLAAPALTQNSGLARGRLVEALHCRADPAQTYTLYLPRGYSEGSAWPALIVMDPRGRSAWAAERFVAAAETYGWVLLSSDGTRSDGPPEPNIRAVEALWAEVQTRYATDRRRIYLAGFSGLASVARSLGLATSQVAGVIASGSPWDEARFPEPLRVPCFGTVGASDFNFTPMRAFHARLREWGTPERLEVFEGAHSWMPADLASRAIEWMELQAMKRGLRPGDDALVERSLARDRERAEQLEAAGRSLDAQRLYQTAAATFGGLIPVGALARAATRLAAEKGTRRALDDEERWEAFERSMLRRHEEAYQALARADLPLRPGRFRADLRVDELQRRARSEGSEGLAARRLLNMLVAQTGFYLMRDFMGREEHARAAACLQIATEIRPEGAGLWYNLACARARTGARSGALDALERAVALGFGRAQLASDEDLRSLHRDPRFQALLAEGPGVPP